jgi:hypothetical protein
LPWWCSLALVALGVLVLRYPIALLIPAFLEDYLFAPHVGGGVLIFLQQHVALLAVALLIVLRYSILAKTRVGLLYS